MSSMYIIGHWLWNSADLGTKQVFSSVHHTFWNGKFVIIAGQFSTVEFFT